MTPALALALLLLAPPSPGRRGCAPPAGDADLRERLEAALGGIDVPAARRPGAPSGPRR
jgi:hypothetical protein